MIKNLDRTGHITLDIYKIKTLNISSFFHLF